MHSFRSAFVRVAATLAAVLGVSFLIGASREPAQATDPILEVFADSLTSYLPSGMTHVQDVRPLVGQRGTNLEGTYRGAPSQHMAIRGNPFENAWSDTNVNGVRLSTGTYSAQEVDIALPADGPTWVVGRSYRGELLVNPDDPDWFDPDDGNVAFMHEFGHMYIHTAAAWKGLSPAVYNQKNNAYHGGYLEAYIEGQARTCCNDECNFGKCDETPGTAGAGGNLGG